MGRIDFGAISAALDPDRCVRRWLPDGRREGHEWVARNPTRGDKHLGSFKINLNTGVWSDFAAGDSGRDLVSLYAYLFHGGDNGKAARELADSEGVQITADDRERAARKVHAIAEGRPEIVMPVPDHAGEPDYTHKRHGQPSRVWAYYNGRQQLLLQVCRFDVEGGRKEICPLSWVRERDGSEHWAWMGPVGDAKRPIYGIDRLAAYPDAEVVVVEGEKSADAGQDLAEAVGAQDRVVFVAWLGGTSAVEHVDVRPLRGRQVTLWPDEDAQRYKRKVDGQTVLGEIKPKADQPGIKAMLVIARKLADVGVQALMVDYDIDESRSGWDIADGVEQGWTIERALAHILDRRGNPYRVAGEVLEDEPPPPEPPPWVDAEPGEPEPMPSVVPEQPRPERQPSGARALSDTLNVFAFPHITDKGQPLSTVENLRYLVDQYGIAVRYNEIRKGMEVQIPGRRYSADNAGEAALAEIVSLATRNRMPKGDIASYLTVIADDRRYNPLLDWIRATPWDGERRLPALYQTLEVAAGHEPLRDALVYRWMLSAVAALALPDGVQAHGVLVLQGGQGLGKTSWMRALVPAELRATLDGAMIDPSNKDTLIVALSHWIVEMGELDGIFRRADIARLKAFVTQGRDTIRMPYARTVSEMPRRTVFFASVNEPRFLVDDTGNRRWWTIPVTGVNYDHGLPMQQVWAEVWEDFCEGRQWWLNSEEEKALAELNEAHAAVDPIEESLLRHYVWDAQGMGREMTATEVLYELGFREPNRQQATHMAKLLAKLVTVPTRRSGGALVWRMPRRKGDADAQSRIDGIPG